MQTDNLQEELLRVHNRDTLNKADLKTYSNSILLIQDIENYKEELTSSTSFEFIDISNQENYYQLFFEILKKLLPSAIATNLEEISARFQSRYKNIHGSGTHIAPISQTQINFKPENDTLDKASNTLLQKIWISLNKFPYLTIFLTIFIALSGFLLYYSKDLSNNPQTSQISKSVTTKQDNVIQILPKFFEALSIRNLTKEEAETNYSIIKQFDQIIEQIDSGQIQKYFSSETLQPNELMNSLYNLNAIGSYLLFKEHNAGKAEKILKFAKSLAEDYLCRRSRLNINFDKLTAAETYTEVSTIKDLPEMYTITIYFLGRSAIYQKDIVSAQKYFELSRYLGEKLGLFEQVLSLLNLAIIKGDQIDINIKNKNYTLAKQEIQECISLYENIREDDKKYKKNYRPNNHNPITTTPKDDAHNIIECIKRILRLYTKLILITDNANEHDIYLKMVSDQLIGTNTSPGILEILTTKSNDQLTTRIVADSYNTIGYFLLQLWDKKIDFSQFKKNIIVKLNLTCGNDNNSYSDLEVIYQIFNLAKEHSRSTEFSKADAYDGLAQVCERMLIQPNITEEKKRGLLIQIKEFNEGRDFINKELNRIS